MNTDIPSYRGYRFPREIISYDVSFYFRFRLSFRDVEDLLADLSQDAIRQ
jgi:putative transposase